MFIARYVVIILCTKYLFVLEYVDSYTTCSSYLYIIKIWLFI